jgi:hypothetical protein
VSIAVEACEGWSSTFNIFEINYPCLTKYSIEKDGGANHASKKGHCEGQTYLLSFLSG